MNTKQIVGVAAIGALLGAGVVLFVEKVIKPHSAIDDAPIIVAGGSLHIILPDGWEFRPDGNNPMVLWNTASNTPVTGKYSSAVAAYKPDGTPLDSVSYVSTDEVDVIVKFCSGILHCNGNPNFDRTITLHSDATRVTLDEDNEHFGAFVKPFGSYLKHGTKRDFQIYQIQTRKAGNIDKTWPCGTGNGGDCDIRIDYKKI